MKMICRVISRWYWRRMVRVERRLYERRHVQTLTRKCVQLKAAAEMWEKLGR